MLTALLYVAVVAVAWPGAAVAVPLLSHISSGGAAAPNDTVVLAGSALANASAHLCPLRGGGACLTLPAQPSSWDGGLKVCPHRTLPPLPHHPQPQDAPPPPLETEGFGAASHAGAGAGTR
jgi:hypothetical protein